MCGGKEGGGGGGKEWGGLEGQAEEGGVWEGQAEGDKNVCRGKEGILPGGNGARPTGGRCVTGHSMGGVSAGAPH